jgi:excinuclease ABC subunit C
LYPLRTCTYDLNRSNVQSGKIQSLFRIPLWYLVACREGKSEEDYQKKSNTSNWETLKGNFKESLRWDFKQKNEAFAEEMEFWKQAQKKLKKNFCVRRITRSTVLNPVHVDVFFL